MESSNYFRDRKASSDEQQRQELGGLDRLVEQRRIKRAETVKILLNPAGNRPVDLWDARAAKLCSDFLEVMRERNFQFARTIQPDKEYWKKVIELVGLARSEVKKSIFGVKTVPVEWNWPQPRQAYDVGVFSFDDETGREDKWSSRIYLCTDGMIRNSSAGTLPTGSGLNIKHLLWRTKVTSTDPIYGTTGHPEPYEVNLEDMLFSRMNGNTKGGMYD